MNRLPIRKLISASRGLTVCERRRISTATSVSTTTLSPRLHYVSDPRANATNRRHHSTANDLSKIIANARPGAESTIKTTAANTDDDFRTALPWPTREINVHSTMSKAEMIEFGAHFHHWLKRLENALSTAATSNSSEKTEGLEQPADAAPTFSTSSNPSKDDVTPSSDAANTSADGISKLAQAESVSRRGMDELHLMSRTEMLGLGVCFHQRLERLEHVSTSSTPSTAVPASSLTGKDSILRAKMPAGATYASTPTNTAKPDKPDKPEENCQKEETMEASGANQVSDIPEEQAHKNKGKKTAGSKTDDPFPTECLLFIVFIASILVCLGFVIGFCVSRITLQDQVDEKSTKSVDEAIKAIRDEFKGFNAKLAEMKVQATGALSASTKSAVKSVDRPSTSSFATENRLQHALQRLWRHRPDTSCVACRQRYETHATPGTSSGGTERSMPGGGSAGDTKLSTSSSTSSSTEGTESPTKRPSRRRIIPSYEGHHQSISTSINSV